MKTIRQHAVTTTHGRRKGLYRPCIGILAKGTRGEPSMIAQKKNTVRIWKSFRRRLAPTDSDSNRDASITVEHSPEGSDGAEKITL